MPTSSALLDRPTSPEPAPDPRRARDRRPADERINRLTSIPFILVHLLPLLAVFTGVSTTAVVLCVVLYFGRMFFITAGYHRYFSHRSYRLNRFWQLVFAFGGASAAQKGPLWWASHHRDHHRYSDGPSDIHSPTQKGFLWSHVGWILCDKYAATDYDRIKDFSKYPELVFLNKRDWIAPWALGIASFLIAGWSGLLIGFFLSTVLLWHATFTVNSLAHVMGRRRYATEDTSRNSVLIAALTMGEGWHNNHHYYQGSARQGFFWWEWDPTYYVLKVLSWLHIVRGLRTPPARVRAVNRVSQGTFDIGMFRAHWAEATRAVASSHVVQVVHDGRVSAGEALVSTRDAAAQSVQARKQQLEGFVHSTLESAEELARVTRRGQRELGLKRG
ncbi:MAG TPA: acyl-CoA desaturase [Acidimicrobiales bacterium]|nr:acyl-CoA desaturase [Acidimicrobiales bacterium]